MIRGLKTDRFYLVTPLLMNSQKVGFVNNIEHFGRSRVIQRQKRKLFEGVSPSFCILAEGLGSAQNAHGESKIDFLRVRQV
jgi:hypothetical protein